MVSCITLPLLQYPTVPGPTVVPQNGTFHCRLQARYLRFFSTLCVARGLDDVVVRQRQNNIAGEPRRRSGRDRRSRILRPLQRMEPPIGPRFVLPVSLQICCCKKSTWGVSLRACLQVRRRQFSWSFGRAGIIRSCAATEPMMSVR